MTCPGILLPDPETAPNKTQILRVHCPGCSPEASGLTQRDGEILRQALHLLDTIAGGPGAVARRCANELEALIDRHFPRREEAPPWISSGVSCAVRLSWP